MKNHKVLFCFTVAFVMTMLSTFGVLTYATEPENLVFELNSAESGYILTDTADDISGSVVIPATYNSLPILEIGDSAFEDTNIVYVEISEGVTTIGDEAFKGCSLLSTVKLPSTLTSIGEFAFDDASEIKKVYIKDVESWNNVSFDESYGYDDYYTCSPLYYGAELYINDTLATNLIFPEGTMAINPAAWRNCPTYKTISFPSTLTSIPSGAFLNCDGISVLDIPSNVSAIGNRAFEDCNSITKVITEDSEICTIGTQAFYGCDNLTVVDLGEGVTTIGDEAFKDCSLLSTVKLPSTLTSIGEFAFDGANEIKKVYIKDVESWNNVSFDESYGYDSYYTCSPLYYGAELYINDILATNLIFPEGTMAINPAAWRNCDSYVSVTFPTSLVSIPEKSFTGCDKLSYVFFLGSEEDWADVSLSDTTITDLAIHYNSADHTESDWIIDGDPTCTETGFKYKECTVCGIVVEAEEIEALGHEYANGTCVNCGEKDPTALNGWILESDKWAYYENGTKVTNKWVKDSVGWCYVGADGYCVTNCWKADSYGWCYLDANGRMVCNNWVLDKGKWYFMDANGYMVSNCWKKDSKGWCYLGSSGAMLTNAWVKDSVGWCYVGADGYCVTNKWVKDSKGWCYLDSNGRMVYNKWVKDSKGWCYVGSSGYMVYNQWVKDGGKWYYLDANGYMVTGTKVINGKTYKFNSSGVWIG